MTSTTRALVWGATEPVPSFSTRETTATDTPASRATSRIVAAFRTGGSPLRHAQDTDGERPIYRGHMPLVQNCNRYHCTAHDEAAGTDPPATRDPIAVPP